MIDRVVNQSLTLIVVGLISASLGGGLYFFFLAWNDLLAGQWINTLGYGVATSAMLAVVWWLCANREDLADR